MASPTDVNRQNHAALSLKNSILVCFSAPVTLPGLQGLSYLIPSAVNRLFFYKENHTYVPRTKLSGKLYDCG